MGRLWTGKGDDGTTGLLFGGRVRKDAAGPEAYGAVDEAQAFIGLARAESERGEDLDAILIEVERDLYVLMGELAAAPEQRHKLVAGTTLVTDEMLARIEARSTEIATRFEPPREFVLPGQDRLSTLLDVARTVVRRAERLALAAAAEGSYVIPYLNRLSTLLWALARWQESEALPSKPPTSPENK